jgi:hypothetical protein
MRIILRFRANNSIIASHVHSFEAGRISIVKDYAQKRRVNFD